MRELIDCSQGNSWILSKINKYRPRVKSKPIGKSRHHPYANCTALNLGDTKPIEVPSTSRGFNTKELGSSAQVDGVRDRRPVLPTAGPWNAEPAVHRCATCPFKLQTAAEACDAIFHPVCPCGWNRDARVGHPVACVDVADVPAAAHIAGVFGDNPEHVRIVLSLNGDCKLICSRREWKVVSERKEQQRPAIYEETQYVQLTPAEPQERPGVFSAIYSWLSALLIARSGRLIARFLLLVWP